MFLVITGDTRSHWFRRQPPTPASVDVFNFDCFGCVIEDCLGGPRLDRRWRGRIDSRFQQSGSSRRSALLEPGHRLPQLLPFQHVLGATPMDFAASSMLC
jgi:hypothetical protein